MSVADVEASAQAVVAAGGSVVAPPADAGAAARAAVVHNDQGTVLSLWQPGLPAGTEAGTVVGRWSAPVLVTGDPGRAAAFYGRGFGWTAVPDRPDSASFQLVGRRVASVTLRPKGLLSARDSLWTVPSTVDDLPAALEQALDRGAGPSLRLPGPDGGALLTDDQGTLLGLRPTG